MHHGVVLGTDEPRYPPPDEGLRSAASRLRREIEPAELRRLVESLPAPRSRLHAPDAMARTDELLLAAWREAGWQVQRQELHLRNVRARLDYPTGSGKGSFPLTRYPRLDGANLLAIKPGSSREAVVVVAHHDTVRGSPGADDNGAALAVLLELGRLLGGRRHERSVVLAAPDFEEIGLVGSRHLVRELRRHHRVTAAIVFDPIGYMNAAPGTQVVPGGIGLLYPGQVRRLEQRGRRGDTLVALYQDRSVELARTWARCLAAAIGEERVLLLRDPGDLPIIGPLLSLALPVVRNFSRSDHRHFWNARLPAIHVTNTGDLRNPHYHRPTDTPASLDYETLADVAVATFLVVDQLGQPR